MRVLSLTNALTDYVVKISEREISEIGLIKGKHASYGKINLEKVKDRGFKKFVGGSPCNTIRGLSHLGVDCSLMGVIGDDNDGKFYLDNLKKDGVFDCFSKLENGESGKCYTFITPDGERSFSANGGVAFDFRHLDFSCKTHYDLFHFSGYELVSDVGLVSNFVRRLKKNGTKISFDLGYVKGIRNNLEDFREIVKISDVLFSTEAERDAMKGLDRVVNREGVWILKKGSRGSVIYGNGEEVKIDCVKTRIKNKNGAGDGYAAGFLKKYLEGADLERCGNYGSRIAAKVCSKEESCF